MPELSLQSLRGLLPQMSGAAFGTTSPQEAADMPPNVLDRALKHALPFEAQAAQPRDETVLYQTKAGPITQGDLDRAMEVGMGVSGGGLSTKGIKAYHSSPHDFDRFDLSKIGTGEGAQVYGHGIYAAENPAVSGRGGEYWNNFLDRFPAEEHSAATLLKGKGWDRDEALKYSQWNIDQLKGYPAELRAKGGWENERSAIHHEKLLERRLREHELLASGQIIGPRTYELNIKADPAQMLDWDKPLRDQPQRAVLLDVARGFSAKSPGAADMYNFLKNEGDKVSSVSGVDFYRSLVNPYARHEAAQASAALHEAGIPGIKYLDEGSRAGMLAPGDRTHNYVVFDPSTIDIMKKYGIAGMAAPALGYGAMRGDE